MQIKSNKFLIYVALERTHEFHVNCHSVTFIIVVNSHQRWKQMFAFIFGVNWLWHCGVTASFGVFFHEMKCNGLTSFMEFMSSWHCGCRSHMPLSLFLQNWGVDSWPHYGTLWFSSWCLVRFMLTRVWFLVKSNSTYGSRFTCNRVATGQGKIRGNWKKGNLDFAKKVKGNLPLLREILTFWMKMLCICEHDA